MPTTKDTTPTTTDNAYEAFLALQAALNEVDMVKDARGNFGKYLSLANLISTLPLVNQHGFMVIQNPTSQNGVPALRTQVIYRDGTNVVDEVMPLMLKSPTPQDQGSAITYAKRYAYSAAFGIVADEDDDGTQAQKAAKEANKTAKEPINAAREGKIYTMLQRLEITLEDYEAKLTANAGKPTTLKDLTNEQADKIIEQMTVAIQRGMVSNREA